VPRRLSVIIPALNEAENIAATIASAKQAGAMEIIVADGGSSDGTPGVAAAHGARVVTGETVRGRQLNAGAAAAGGDVLLFLHADTKLPPGASRMISAAVESGAAFGGFRVRFLEDHGRLHFAAAMINLRTRITRCPWGDQAQFVTRQAFEDAGRFREFPLMEDYELAVRMRRLRRTLLLPAFVRTSGRRFLQHGLVRTSLLNWTVIALYRLGVSPAHLARLYR
jgi:rSAM/selenodomain-associated transferase 2